MHSGVKHDCCPCTDHAHVRRTEPHAQNLCELGEGAHPNKNNPLGHSRQVEVVDNILGNIAVEWEALAVLRGCGGRCTRARCQENTRNAAHAVVRELGGIRPDGGRAIARAQGIRVQNGHRIAPTRRIGSTAWRAARRKTGEKWTLMAHSSLRIGWRGRARWWKMQGYGR